MSTPDPIRAALERLVKELNEYDPKWDAFPEDALAAARAALSAAPGGMPSDQEVADPFAQCYLDSSALRGTSYLSGVRPTAPACVELPAPQPVAVSERPWRQADWCDSFGRCWMGDPGDWNVPFPSWRLCRPGDAPPFMTVSLPAHALPLPATTTTTRTGGS